MVQLLHSLTYLQAKLTDTDDLDLMEKPQGEKQAFGWLLCAMYNRPYEITSIQDLKNLVRLADFYCALPVLSASLTACLLLNPSFGNALSDPRWFQSSEVLLIAKQLRNKFLFRECFIHAVGTFDPGREDPYLSEDAQILNLVQRHHIILCGKVMETQRSLCHALFFRDVPDLKSRMILDLDISILKSRPFYDSIQSELRDVRNEELDDLKEQLHSLLRNNLVLFPTVVSESSYSLHSYFTCAQLDDGDLPWDPEEIDW